MKRIHLVTSIVLGTLYASGCSLINKFDPVDEGHDNLGGESGDGDGDGDTDTGTGGGGENGDGDGDGSGAGDMGGSSSGGRKGSGGETESGSGGEGSGGMPQQADPGLIVVLPQIDGTETRSLFAISPQDGKILHSFDQDEYEVNFAAFEPSRQTWFLNLDGKIVPATFDRVEKQWVLGDDGPETGSILDPYLVFALPDRLVVYEDTGFVVYDTSDLSAIDEVDTVASPPGTPWGVAAVEKSLGGDIQYLAKNCATTDLLECPLELTRISIQAGAVQALAPTEVATIDNSASKGARGNLRYDPLKRKLALLIPNKVGQAGVASVDLWTSVHEHDPAEEITFMIPAGNPGIFSTMAIDPCQSVAYAMLNNDTHMFEIPLTIDPDATVAQQQVLVQGYGIAYEHFTRSILTTQNNTTDGGIDTWTIVGDELVPELEQRIKGWTRPALRPRYIATDEPESFDCQ